MKMINNDHINQANITLMHRRMEPTDTTSLQPQRRGQITPRMSQVLPMDTVYAKLRQESPESLRKITMLLHDAICEHKDVIDNIEAGSDMESVFSLIGSPRGTRECLRALVDLHETEKRYLVRSAAASAYTAAETEGDVQVRIKHREMANTANLVQHVAAGCAMDMSTTNVSPVQAYTLAKMAHCTAAIHTLLANAKTSLIPRHAHVEQFGQRVYVQHVSDRRSGDVAIAPASLIAQDIHNTNVIANNIPQHVHITHQDALRELIETPLYKNEKTQDYDEIALSNARSSLFNDNDVKMTDPRLMWITDAVSGYCPPLGLTENVQQQYAHLRTLDGFVPPCHEFIESNDATPMTLAEAANTTNAHGDSEAAEVARLVYHNETNAKAALYVRDIGIIDSDSVQCGYTHKDCHLDMLLCTRGVHVDAQPSLLSLHIANELLDTTCITK